MKQTNNDDTPHYLRRVLLVIGIVLLVILNYFYFREKISSNSELITRFAKKADPMEKYRHPAVAGLFYAAAPQDLNDDVVRYLNAAGSGYEKMPKMLIVPHAGYQYSAPAAAQAYRPLADFAGRIKTVILLGPAHWAAVKGAALSSADWFVTPLGKVPVDRELTASLSSVKGFAVNDAAHKDEHSLEVQLPFLQKVLGDFKIVPIVYGALNPQDTAEALRPYLEEDGTLLVVSADLSHYYPYEDAQAADHQTASQINDMEPELKDHQSCGAGGINTALIMAQLMYLQPEILSLINSGDTAGSKENVVGYGAWAFTPTGRTEQEAAALESYAGVYKRELLRIARTALEESVIHDRAYEPSREDYDDELFDKGAAFVTLEKEGALRGCIGSLYPKRAVALDIAENTRNAAAKDGRFMPVTVDELDKINISVSLLTGFERIFYQSEEDLLNRLQKGIDGLVIRDGNRQGLFLPSVWKQLPDKEEFLRNLKLKAGMSPSYWSNAIKVYRFRTVEIKENEN